MSPAFAALLAVVLTPSVSPIDPNCPERSVAELFPAAVCVCGDYQGAAALTLEGAANDNNDGASFGVNGSVRSNAAIAASGDMTVAGLGGVQSSGSIAVANLNVSGPLRSNGTITVDQNAQLGADVQANIFNVGGIATVDPRARMWANVPPARIVAAPVSIKPPCPCDAAALGIHGLLQQAAQSNDDQAAGLTATSLHLFSQAQNLTLPSGTYYLEDILGNAPVTITASGRVALFIRGSVASNHPVQFLAASDASLDVYVGGGIFVTDPLVFGSNTQPSAARLWVLGQLSLRQGIQLSGLVYAPDAQMNVAGPVSLVGAVVVGQLNHSQPFNAVYDSTIHNIGNACDGNTTPPEQPTPSPTPEPPSTTPPTTPEPPSTTPPPAPPQACNGCSDCSQGATCQASVCVPCSDAAPCCDGLVCNGSGVCVPNNQSQPH